MSFNYYQNGKYATLPQNPAQDMEVTQDMHLKMSKKIAQLTKVIYALNTKNDEHEAVIQQLKEQHEDEIQQLLKETKEKVSVYRQKLETESQHSKKIEQLEQTIQQHAKYKDKHLSQFEEFKQHAEQREMQLKTENAQKMLELSGEVLLAKKEFEEKMKQFDEWQQKVESEKERFIKDLNEKHIKELEECRNYYRGQNDDWLNETKKLEEKYKSELESLQNNYKTLEEAKSQMADDYEAKLAKAQLFYEKELEAVMSKNNMSAEDAQKMMQTEREKLKKEFAAQIGELKKQIDSLVTQVTEKEDEVDKLKEEIDRLTKLLGEKEGNSSELSLQLQEALKSVSEAQSKWKNAESELAVMKERCTRQEQEMLQKSSLIGKLEATKLQNESTIGELEGDINRLRDKLSWLEKERTNLERQKSDINQTQSAQVKSLEKALEDLSIEKQTMKEKYEREIENLHKKYAKSERDLEQQHKDQLETLRQQGLSDMAAQKKLAEDLLEQEKQMLTIRYTTELEAVSTIRDNLKAELERVRSELSSRLKASEDEVARLNSIIQNTEQGLGSATGMINNLKDANNKLQQQLEKAKADHKEEKSRSASLQGELDRLKLQLEAQLKESKAELQQRLTELTNQMEAKWQDTLRLECSKLREEIYEQKEREMRAALEQLSRMKDEEIHATRQGWEAKVADLNRQLASLRDSLKDKDSQSQVELEKLRQQVEEERKRLEQELMTSAEEYLRKIQTMEVAHADNVAKLKEQKEQELDELKRTLQTKHIDDMQAQMTAHKLSLESVKEQTDKTKLEELRKQREELQKEKDNLLQQLQEEHLEELERKKREHEQQLNAARMELQRAVEISRQKEKDHALRVEDLQGEITHRERHITNLKEDTGKLQHTINQLNQEIDFKRQDIQKIKSDTQNQIRMKEKQLSEKMQKALDNLQADHLRESQELIHQFNQAQEILKDKISELQIELDEAEERYANRESRPEDLELIEQLRQDVIEKEQRVKALIEEKKFYQMELVNRETNFNKVFSASPNVGVLNPLDSKKRRGSKGNGSAPNLSGRLDPLPGSPMHHSQLNPSKPLPPFAKKFVK